MTVSQGMHVSSVLRVELLYKAGAVANDRLLKSIRNARMPIGLSLIHVSNVQELRLVKRCADQLQPNGQASDKAARNRQRRHAREIRADGVDIVQVHRDRIVDLGAE